eukprot:852660-Rhodomonas_salina.3
MKVGEADRNASHCAGVNTFGHSATKTRASERGQSTVLANALFLPNPQMRCGEFYVLGKHLIPHSLAVYVGGGQRELWPSLLCQQY